MNEPSPLIKPGIICIAFLIIGLVIMIAPVTAACASGYNLCNGKCLSCPSGSILGSDCKCHAACGDTGRSCINGKCCDDHCVNCPAGYILGTDCLCHKSCGSSDLYCTSGTCCNDRCVSCSSGYLGTDCKCHSEVTNTITNSQNSSNDGSDDQNIEIFGKIGTILAKIVSIISKIF